MTVQRLIAILFIFACTCAAWFVLGASLIVRTGESDQSLAKEVEQLWGGRHLQVAPTALIERTSTTAQLVPEKDAQGNMVVKEVSRTTTESTGIPLSSSRVRVSLKLDQRRKGLLWYDTYAVSFEAAYKLRNPDEVERTVCVQLAFPSKQAIYDRFSFRVGGREVPFNGDIAQGLAGRILVPPGGETTVDLVYDSRGLGDWVYAFAPAGVSQVKDFQLEMTTDFGDIDFPAGTISPARTTCSADGCRLAWEFSSLVTGQRIGMDLPNRINPGPLASRITFFAPVSLLFFLTVMLILGMLNEQNLHPMNYFFIAAAFFSFHLLLAYLVDHINIHAAFLLAAATSIFLVVSYLKIVVGPRFALLRAGAAQLVFLVLFSYAFFFEGYTGLTVTIGSILTLFALMQITGRVDWARLFARPAPGNSFVR